MTATHFRRLGKKTFQAPSDCGSAVFMGQSDDNSVECVAGMQLLERAESQNDDLSQRGSDVVSVARIGKKKESRSFVYQRCSKDMGDGASATGSAAGSAAKSAHSMGSSSTGSSFIQNMRRSNLSYKYQAKQKSAATEKLRALPSAAPPTVSVRQLLLDPDGVLAQPFPIIMEKIENYASQADTYQKDQHYRKALQEHNALQELALACMNSESFVMRIDQEAKLRYALAQSPFRMGLIYELEDNEMQDCGMATKLFKRSLEYYIELKTHLAVTGLIQIRRPVRATEMIGKNKYQNKNMAFSHAIMQESLDRKLALKQKLVSEVCEVKLTLSHNYREEGKFSLARKSCEDALLIMGDEYIDTDTIWEDHTEALQNQAWVSQEEMSVELEALRLTLERQVRCIQRSSGAGLSSRSKNVYNRKHEIASTLSDGESDTGGGDGLKGRSSASQLTMARHDFVSALIGVCFPYGYSELDKTIYSAFVDDDDDDDSTCYTEMSPQTSAPKTSQFRNNEKSFSGQRSSRNMLERDIERRFGRYDNASYDYSEFSEARDSINAYRDTPVYYHRKSHEKSLQNKKKTFWRR
jgi:hypothetical protein